MPLGANNVLYSSQKAGGEGEKERMKKKLFAIMFASLMVATICSAISTSATVLENDEVSENISNNLATVRGQVVSRFGWGMSANVWVWVKGEEEYDSVPTNLKGYFECNVEADEQGTTYMFRAYRPTVQGKDWASQTEEITVYPGGTYDLPNDLILIPLSRIRQVSINPFLLSFLHRFPILSNLLGFINQF